MSVEWVRADWPAPANIIAGTTTRAKGVNELPSEPIFLNQVHGADVLKVGEPAFDSGPPNADALISSRANEVIAVRTADCLPVLFCSNEGNEIAAAHCGWRGLVAGVLANTIEAMQTPASDIIAWLGPAISQAAFEVGDDVRDAFTAADRHAANCFEANERGRWQADLYALAHQQLTRSGVEKVHGGGLCTYTDSTRFFSYRRDGETGRMVTFIYRL